MSQMSLSFESSLLVRDIGGEYRTANNAEVLLAAQRVLAEQMRGTQVMTSPQAVRDYLRAKLGALEHEVFGLLMLDSQHRLLEYVELFRGTVSQASIYPREVVKECLRFNSVAVVMVHNHPSGLAEPSRADETLTTTLKSALSLVDVRVLDHLIVAGTDVMSFAECGRL
jgi:DNA repair protein RadC